MTDYESHKVFPSSHRGTGNGVAIGLNRIMGIVSAVVGQAANVSTFIIVSSAKHSTNPLYRRRHRFQSLFVLHCTLCWQLWPRLFHLNRMVTEAAEL